jgi:hypothetical protein
MLMMDEATYRVEYQKILDNLDPGKVFEDLGERSVPLVLGGSRGVLSPTPGAEWLEAHLGVMFPELRGPNLFDNL